MRVDVSCDGPEEFRVVGETEFVQGVAAESASGRMAICAPRQASSAQRIAAGRPRRSSARGPDRREPAAVSAHRHGAAWAEPGVLPSGSVAARNTSRPSVPAHLILDLPSGAATRTCAPMG